MTNDTRVAKCVENAKKQQICLTADHLKPMGFPEISRGAMVWLAFDFPLFVEIPCFIMLWRSFCCKRSGLRFNIKMSYQYRKSHCGDKTVVRSSYLHNGISYTGKMTSFYWISPLSDIDPDNMCNLHLMFRCKITSMWCHPVITLDNMFWWVNVLPLTFSTNKKTWEGLPAFPSECVVGIWSWCGGSITIYLDPFWWMF